MPLTPRAASPGMVVAHGALSRPVLWWLRANVTGRGYIPGAGGVLLAANHRSFIDHFVMAAASPRPMRFLGKVELSRGLMGRINVAMGMVAVERGKADLNALDEVVTLLRAGAVVGVFPEGTRSPTGELFRFRSGAARLAAAAQVPCVPVALHGMTEVWPRHGRPVRRRPPRGTVGVEFLPPVPPPSTDARERRQWTATVHGAIAEACDQPLSDRFAPVAPEEALTPPAPS